MSNLLNNITLTIKNERPSDNGWSREHICYTCVIKYNGKQYTVDYNCNPKWSSPSKESVLSACIMDAECIWLGDSSPYYFMQEYGYDYEDATRLSKACLKTANSLERLFTDAEIGELIELLEDYR